MSNTKGAIVAIGGAADETVLRPMVDTAKGPESRVLLFTSASRLSLDELHSRYGALLERTGVKNWEIIHPTNPEEANRPDLVEKIPSADVLFFGGGDQSRLVDVFKNTALLQAIIKHHEQGAVLAGTSAGAAAMADPMIIGGRPEDGLDKGAIRIASGFGIIPGVFIDTHNLQRARITRLFNLLMQKPEYVGIGLDENTAVILRGNTLEVVGENSVIITDLSEARDSNAVVAKTGHPMAAWNIHFHPIIEGWTYDFKNRSFIAPS